MLSDIDTPEVQIEALQARLAATEERLAAAEERLAEAEAALQATHEGEITVELLRLVTACTDVRALAQAAVAFFREHTGCGAVGLRLRDGEDFPYFETQACPPEFLPVDPAQPFFTTHGSFYVNNTTARLAGASEAERQERTYNRCQGEDYQSVAWLPLRVGTECIGLLQLNDRRPETFTAETIAHWERLADHLAVGLARLLAAAALRRSEERFRSVLDHSLDIIYRLNAQTGEYEYISPSIEAVLGFSPAEVLTQDCHTGFDRIHPDDLPGVRAALARLEETGDVQIEYRQQAKNGEYRWLSNHMSLLRDDSGRPLYRDGIIRDTSKRKQAEAERERLLATVQRQAAELETTISSVAGGMMVYDADGYLVRISPAAAAMLGYSDADCASHVTARVQQARYEHPDGSPYLVTEFPVVRALHGEIVTNEVQVLKLPERTCWFSMSAAPIITADGWQSGAVLTLTDITELHAMQEQMQTFIQLVSHDLRIPLTIAQGYMSYLKDCVFESENSVVKMSVDAIARAVKRMNVMIDDLVVVSRMEDGHLPLTCTTLALPAWLSEFLERSSRALEIGRVQVELPATLPPLTADADRLERILTNLLSNALKYSDPGTPVRLSVHPREGACCFAVTDLGRGIDPEHLPHLFEKFYRADSSRKADGIGLGLYITRLMVEAHGGHIWAESEVGAGSTFAFTIPFAYS